MKKLFKLCAAAALLALAPSCSDQETMESVLTQEVNKIANEYISPAKAIELANEFAAKMDASEPESRSLATRRASSIANVTSLGGIKSRSLDDQIYVVDYDDNQGFALISKKSIDTPVLAFIPDGSYDAESAETNPGFQEFVNRANEILSQQNISTLSSSTADPNFSRDSIGFQHPLPPDSLNPSIPIPDLDYSKHFIHNNWYSLGGIFGKYCPNNEAGCGPTAIAMIFAYYKKPSSIKITFDGSNRTLNLDWKTLSYHLEDIDPTTIYGSFPNPDHDLWPECRITMCTKESHEAISLLVRQIGHDLGAVYDSDGTGVALGQIYQKMCTRYNFTMNPFSSFNKTTLKSAMQNKYPALLSSGGHIWICDGYYQTTTDDVVNDYFHYNWGWGKKGDLNGFYLSGVFDPRETSFHFDTPKMSVVKP